MIFFNRSRNFVLFLALFFSYQLSAQTVTATRTGGGTQQYSCDGVNDEVQINQALEYVKDTGGVVELDANTFMIDSVIYFAGNNTTLKGVGIDATTIKLVDNAGWCYYYQDGGEWILHHAGPVIMNRAEALSGLVMKDIKFDGNKYKQWLYDPTSGDTIRSPQLDGQGHYIMINFQRRDGSSSDLSDITISYVDIHENNGDGFDIRYVNNLTIDHCVGTKGGHSYIYLLDPINFTAEYNSFEVTSNSGIRWYDGNHIKIRNNYIYGEYAKTGNSNFCVQLTSGQTSTITDDVIIENNKFEFTAGAAIALDAKDPKSAKNVIIRNNRILQCGNSGTTENMRETGGINLKNFTNTIIENNTIVNCIGGGVRLGGNTGFNTEWPYIKGLTANIRNNIITNCVQGGNSTNKTYGIDIAEGNSATCEFNNVWNNTDGNYNGCEPGKGSFSSDPLFKSVVLGEYFYDTNDKNADLHLKSQMGRYNSNTSSWQTDSETSSAINAGDPNSEFSNEPTENGDRINLGAYGNTNYASKSTQTVPMADAGPDQFVRDDNGDGVVFINLDGSATKFAGNDASYIWTRNGSQIATGATPTNVAFVLGEASVTLTVTDNGHSSSDIMIVKVSSGGNIAPVADAGPDIIETNSDGSGSETITLDGSASSDEDGTISSYVWKENGATIGEGVSPSVSFSEGIHNITLTVTDNEDATDTDDLIVEIKGKHNYALNFNSNSNDEYVSIENVPTNFNTLTIEMWIKQINSSDDTDALLYFGGDGQRLTVKGSTHQVSWDESYDNTSLKGLEDLNEWHHIAFVVKEGTLDKIYVDGVDEGIYSEAEITLPSSVFAIASYYGSAASDLNFKGKIDELRYWNTERTSTEINDSKDVELNGDENGLVGYWNFNDGSGTVLTDICGAANGTLNNMEADDWTTDTPFSPATAINDTKNKSFKPTAYHLSQNYPNPFNPTTNISFELPETQMVKLSVFNILGEKIIDLIDNTVEAGHHSIKFDASNLTSGVYIYKFSTANFVSVKKLILLK